MTGYDGRRLSVSALWRLFKSAKRSRWQCCKRKERQRNHALSTHTKWRVAGVSAVSVLPIREVRSSAARVAQGRRRDTSHPVASPQHQYKAGRAGAGKA
eukprot:scaffold14264_cov118-Isochrysis_galbana.AAC.1